MNIWQLFVLCTLQWSISSVEGFEFGNQIIKVHIDSELRPIRSINKSQVTPKSRCIGIGIGIGCRRTSLPPLLSSRTDNSDGDDQTEPPPSSLSTIPTSHRRPPAVSSSTRRAIILTTFLLTIQSSPSPSLAAAGDKPARVKGAAEYDFEYYVQDALKGNKREGTRPASPPPPPLPPRTLADTQGFVTKLILNERCDGDCLSVRELAKLLSSPDDTAAKEREISKRVVDLRDRVSKSFYTRNPWKDESVLDSYYFDLTSYALFRIASDLIPKDYALRDRWVRNVGRCLYGEVVRLGLVRRPTAAETGKVVSLTDTVPAMLQILDLFNSTNYLDTYRFVGDEAASTTAKKTTSTKSTNTAANNNNDAAVFDSYDNEDLESGTDVNFLLSLTKPTTLGAALQITGEESRFTPEFVGPVLMAMWEDELGLGLASDGGKGGGSGGKVKAQVEGYFVDGTYRPNPKDFFPDELLLQFTLKQK